MSETQYRVHSNHRQCLSSSDYDLIHEVLALLDEPAEEWNPKSIGIGAGDRLLPILRGRVNAWKDADAISTTPVGNARNGDLHAFEPHFIERVDAYEPNGVQLPCGHHGVSNTPAGYTCPREWCEAVFSRATVEEAMQ